MRVRGRNSISLIHLAPLLAALVLVTLLSAFHNVGVPWRDRAVRIPRSQARTSAAPRSARRVLAPGDYCGNCPDPVQRVFGVEFRHGDLWIVTIDGTLTHLSSCQTIDVHNIKASAGFATGLGYDSSIRPVRRHGCVQRGSAGGRARRRSAQDLPRARHWLDWRRVRLDPRRLLDPPISRPIRSTPSIPSRAPPSTDLLCPPARVVSGAAYDAALDAIYYNDRVLDARCYYVSAQDMQRCSDRSRFPTPDSMDGTTTPSRPTGTYGRTTTRTRGCTASGARRRRRARARGGR